MPTDVFGIMFVQDREISTGELSWSIYLGQFENFNSYSKDIALTVPWSEEPILIELTNTTSQDPQPGYALGQALKVNGCNMEGLEFDVCPMDEPIWDFLPLSIRLEFVDTLGNNIFSNADNSLTAGTYTATFDNKTYSTVWPPESRHLLADDYGLKIDYDHGVIPEDNDRLMIFIGEFDLIEDFDKEITLTVPWREMPYTINMTNRFGWNSPLDPWSEQTLTIDGSPYEYSNLTPTTIVY